MGFLSFLIPGFAQLLQGRIVTASCHFILCLALWSIGAGWVVHCWSCLDALGHQERARQQAHKQVRALGDCYLRAANDYARKHGNAGYGRSNPYGTNSSY